MINEYDNHANYHTQAYTAVLSTNRWFAIRLDAIVSIYSAFVVYACIFAKGYKRNLKFKLISF
jgi:hypothetical protein